MKRKQRWGIFTAEMKQESVDRMADIARQAASWTGKVGAATAMLALVGVLAPPDAPGGGQHAGTELPRRIGGL